MGYIERLPHTVNELYENLQKLYQNKTHIVSVTMNTTTSHLEVRLDSKAHFFGGSAGQDFFLPIKRDKQREALALAERVWHGNTAPTEQDAKQLFDMLDPSLK